MTATDIIATIALAVSGVSATAAGLSLWLQVREADRRDEEIRLVRDEAGRRDEEIRLVRDEAGRRDEEVRLLAAQVEEARSHRLAAERARLTITRGPVEGSERAIAYTLKVTNAGPRFAANVLLRLRDRQGRIAGETMRAEPILDGATIEIVVETPPRERYHGPYQIDLSWDDARGRSQTILHEPVLALP